MQLNTIQFHFIGMRVLTCEMEFANWSTEPCPHSHIERVALIIAILFVEDQPDLDYTSSYFYTSLQPSDKSLHNWNELTTLNTLW